MLEINTIARAQIDKIAAACNRIKPKVVISSLAYNHELYVKDALEGFVMQKTNFPIVAIVHEDCSTDNTAKIIKEYEKKYPDIIFPIFEEENQYSKQNGTLSRIMRTAIAASGAKYVAMCECDDYWTDPLKLQKQVDFLESHPDYSMCFTSAKIRYDNNKIRQISNKFDHVQSREYSLTECFNNWLIPTCSIVYKAEITDKIPKDENFKVGDNVLTTTCFKHGKVIGIKDQTCVYRRTENGWTAQSLYLQKEIAISHTTALKKHFPEHSDILDNYIIDAYSIASIYAALHFDKSFFKYFRIGLQKYRSRFLVRIIFKPFKALIRRCTNNESNL